jgi:hypothetical protein
MRIPTQLPKSEHVTCEIALTGLAFRNVQNLPRPDRNYSTLEYDPIIKPGLE